MRYLFSLNLLVLNSISDLLDYYFLKFREQEFALHIIKMKASRIMICLLPLFINFIV